MATLLNDSEVSLELNALIRGGRTIAIDRPQEMEALIRLCRESRALGLGHIYEWLERFGEWMDWVGIDGGQRRRSEFEEDDPLWKHPHNLTGTEGLEVSLKWALEMWAGGEEVRILVSVASGSELIYEGDTPGLFFYQGSLQALITPFTSAGKFVLAMGSFAVGMCVTPALLPQIQAEKLVAQLREQAREKAQFPDLPVLDDVTPEDLRGKRGMILLLHGLFSTDMSTFDGFIEAWQRRPAFPYPEVLNLQYEWRMIHNEPDHASSPGERDYQDAFAAAIQHDYLIVGWPHDTLTGIERNAGELSALLVNLDPELPVVLVCHSRGGLLARKVSQTLFDRDAGDWKNRIPLCVTFGTPHEGAELAEHPLKLVATFLMVMAGTANVASLPRVLAVYGNRKQFDGVEDLRPDSEFLTALTRDEVRAAPAGRTRKLEIYPVGGVYRSHKAFPQTFVSALLGTHEHDLVVRKKSSVPGGFGDGTVTDCGHGEYFGASQTGTADFVGIIERIRVVLGVEGAMLDRAEAHPFRR